MATTTDVLEERIPARATYAEPLSGLRVSWGSVMAGTAAFLAISLLLWSLAFAIVMLATHATLASLKGSAIALWICGVGTTIIGASVGGWLAGYLPGNPRGFVGAAHGFASWSVALLVSAVFQAAVFGSVLASASATAEGAAAATDTSAGGQSGPSADARAQQALVSLGYSPEEASRILGQAPSSAREALGPRAGAPSGQGVRSEAAMMGRDLIGAGIGVGWTWFGTWAVALAVAVIAAGRGARASDRILPRLEGERIRREPPVGTYRPVPSA